MEIWNKKWADLSEDERQTLRNWFKWWRIVNWAIISFLVIRAVFALTWLLPADFKGAIRLIASIAIIAYSMVNVFVWANQTDMDAVRMNSGVRITLVSTVVIIACRVLRYIGVLLDILLVRANFWPVMILYPLLAGAVYFSVIKEKQMTDKKLGKDRTPPKKTHHKGQLGRDSEGNLVFETEDWTG